MKARVKATGEMVEVEKIDGYTDTDGNPVDIFKGYSKYYSEEDLDFEDIEPDYWEKLKHQYAGMAMQGVLSNEKMQQDLHNAFGKVESMDITIADFAVDMATTLIKKLKNEK